jgi:multidrug efflux pump subunit AcrA (membrane-fusion protein)
MQNGCRSLTVLALVLLLGCDPPLDMGKADLKPDKPAAPVPAEGGAKTGTYKVAKGTVKTEVTCKGVVEAEATAEVLVKTEAWGREVMGTLMVKTAVDHGTAVKKGDVLVQLDTEKIDRVIREMEADHQLAELALHLAEDELPLLEKGLPLDMAAAERAKKQADDDLKKFLEVDRPLLERTAQFAFSSSSHYLEYAKEELRQLEKMYRSKDLTEETEEIILKRQRHAVESAEFAVTSAEHRRDQALKVDLPRQEQTLRDNAVKQAIALDRSKESLPVTLSQKRLALEKQRYEFKKATDKLRNLQKDRDLFIVRAPADGVVYYGRCVRGQWGTAGAAAAKLQPGGTVMPDEVFMTVVLPRPDFVRAQVEEKDLHLIHPGLKGKVTVTGFPDLKLPAEVTDVSALPLAGGNYEVKLHVDLGKEAAAVMPGMTCSAKLVPILKKDALLVPSSAVFADEADEDAHYVYLAGKNAKGEKRAVKLGTATGGKTEILEGLSEGDEILLAKPEGSS